MRWRMASFCVARLPGFAAFPDGRRFVDGARLAAPVRVAPFADRFGGVVADGRRRCVLLRATGACFGECTHEKYECTHAMTRVTGRRAARRPPTRVRSP